MFKIFFQFIAVNFALILSALIITFALYNYKINQRSKIIIATTIVYFSEIILMEIFLSVFKALTPTNISLLSCSFLVVLGLIFRKKISKKLHVNPIKKLPLFTLIAVFAPIAVLLLMRSWNVMLQIPMEYDSVAYHLPFVAKWAQTGDLLKPYYAAFVGLVGYYPGNYELIDLWTVLLNKTDFFINLINFPLLILLAFTVYKICQNFKISKRISIITAGLLIYMPVVLYQAGIPQVDLFLGLTFAISIYFLQEIIKNKNIAGDALILGLTLGLHIGTKYLGLIYAVIPLLLFIVFSRKLKPLMVFFLGIILTGSFFYIRNLLDTGNPLFPVTITILGTKIFEGYRGINEAITSSSLIENLNSLTVLKNFLIKFYKMIGPQLLLIITALLGNLLYLIVATVRKRSKNLTKGWLLTTCTIIYFYLYIKAPYTYRDMIENIRYSIPFLILGCVSVGYLVSKNKSLKKIFYATAFLIFGYNLTTLIKFHPPEITLTLKYLLYLGILAISIIIFIGLFVVKKIYMQILLIIISFLGFWKIYDFTIQERENLIPYFNNAWYGDNVKMVNLMNGIKWLNENTPESKIAYAGFQFQFHLYGRNFKNKVDYININECTECTYQNYKNSKDGIRRDPDYKNWLENLKKKEKEYLIVEPTMTDNVKVYEFNWADNHPEKFEKIWSEGNTYIYKILP